MYAVVLQSSPIRECLIASYRSGNGCRNHRQAALSNSPVAVIMRLLEGELFINQLSHKQRRFAQLVADGATYTSAYLQVYSDRGKLATARSEGSRLAKHPGVVEAIQEFQQPLLRPVQEAYLKTVRSLLQQMQFAATARNRSRALQALAALGTTSGS